MLYDDLKQYITDKMYTIVECQNMLNNYYKYKQLTDEQYDELMELSKSLEANSSDDSVDMSISVINEEIKKINERLKNIEDTLNGQGTTIPSLDEADGSEFNPITAYKGLHYKANLYYLDLTNNEIYKCRDMEATRGNGKQLSPLPHELVNTYFDWVRKA